MFYEGKTTFKLGPNSHMDMTAKEFAAHFNGLIKKGHLIEAQNEVHIAPHAARRTQHKPNHNIKYLKTIGVDSKEQ